MNSIIKYLTLYIFLQILSKSTYSFSLTSKDIQQNKYINPIFTPQGNDINPSFSWTKPPTNTLSFVFLVDDPDSPSGVFNHWAVYNINPNEYEISKGKVPSNAIEVNNSWGIKRYKGPSPPDGETHNYKFILFCLSVWIDDVNLDLVSLRVYIEKYSIDKSEIVAKYKK